MAYTFLTLVALAVLILAVVLATAFKGRGAAALVILVLTLFFFLAWGAAWIVSPGAQGPAGSIVFPAVTGAAVLALTVLAARRERGAPRRSPGAALAALLPYLLLFCAVFLLHYLVIRRI